MPIIHVLDEPTINQIAAGEVVERPSAVVKELIENAMDAGATAITAEIKEGGLSLIRITDNGAGIARDDIPLAFLRHATSKIRTAEDLLSVTSLGFRGEALSSIAAVAQVELITKTPTALNGYRYLIEGGEEKSFEEIGCPGGTTIIIRNLFYNTPARRKFLKSAVTEAGYISDLMERLMVSHPGVSFKYIVNNQVKLQSSGNNSCKDILYQVYGRDISKELLPIEFTSENLNISGFIGKPVITRGNRNFENYFINGRYIKSNIITKAVEEAYKSFMMQHKYPFVSLYFEIPPALIDVNVHPQKMEIRLKNSEEVYQLTIQAIQNTLAGKEMIPRIMLTPEDEGKEKVTSQNISMPEPFEESRRKSLGFQGSQQNVPQNTQQKFTQTIQQKVPEINIQQASLINLQSVPLNNLQQATQSNLQHAPQSNPQKTFQSNLMRASQNNQQLASLQNTEINKEPDSSQISDKENSNLSSPNIVEENNQTTPINFEISINTQADNRVAEQNTEYLSLKGTVTEQMNLFDNTASQPDAPFLSKKALEEHRIIGQIFSTYWLVEYKKELYIIDQHAAHEKVLYERIITAAKDKSYVSQQLLPPIVLSLTLREQEVLHKYEEVLSSLGYEFEPFGGNEFSVRAVPADLFGISEKELLLEFLDDLAEDFVGNTVGSSSILERVASLSCKAAVKANHTLSNEEAAALVKELLMLENPYHCPHGRPVIISMSQYELERKFKRVL